MVFFDCIQIVPQIDIFVRSGHIALTHIDSTFRTVGLVGYAWSSYATSVLANGTVVPSGYRLYFHGTGVNPSGGPDYRAFGLPLRWFCRGGVPIF